MTPRPLARPVALPRDPFNPTNSAERSTKVAATPNPNLEVHL